jgi:hypothetical protein
MAKEYHYCEGCSAETVVYATNRAEAQRKLKWWQETKPLCGKCEAKKDFVAAVERANELELVDLVGTEAQVEWAQRIRVPIIVELMEVSERGGAYVKYKEDVLAHLCTISSAAWWIEDGRSYDLVDRVHRQLKAAAQPKNDPVIMGTVELEATLRPETPVTETIATLRKVTDTLVIVRFDEKREDFREAIKAFGFKWNDVQKKWDLMCNPDQSSAITIEVGAHLLGCGFPVRILDTEIREAIRAGDVAKSDGRQIDYAGKDHFRVDWRRIDGDYYDEVRKIPLSKWDKENQTVLVPIGAADDLRDFASRFGFPMTERATAAAAAFDEYRRAGMVDGKKRKKGEVVEVLDRTAFPDMIKIDQSLLD